LSFVPWSARKKSVPPTFVGCRGLLDTGVGLMSSTRTVPGRSRRSSRARAPSIRCRIEMGSLKRPERFRKGGHYSDQDGAAPGAVCRRQCRRLPPTAALTCLGIFGPAET